MKPRAGVYMHADGGRWRASCGQRKRAIDGQAARASHVRPFSAGGGDGGEVRRPARQRKR